MFTSYPALYWRIGSSRELEELAMSQMRAEQSSPAVQICVEEHGAQAMALTALLCPLSSATGTPGVLISIIKTDFESIAIVAR